MAVMCVPFTLRMFHAPSANVAARPDYKQPPAPKSLQLNQFCLDSRISAWQDGAAACVRQVQSSVPASKASDERLPVHSGSGPLQSAAAAATTSSSPQQLPHVKSIVSMTTDRSLPLSLSLFGEEEDDNDDAAAADSSALMMWPPPMPGVILLVVPAEHTYFLEMIRCLRL